VGWTERWVFLCVMSDCSFGGGTGT
jgi:hypothetical protein